MKINIFLLFKYSTYKYSLFDLFYTSLSVYYLHSSEFQHARFLEYSPPPKWLLSRSPVADPRGRFIQNSPPIRRVHFYCSVQRIDVLSADLVLTLAIDSLSLFLNTIHTMISLKYCYNWCSTPTNQSI